MENKRKESRGRPKKPRLHWQLSQLSGQEFSIHSISGRRIGVRDGKEGEILSLGLSAGSIGWTFDVLDFPGGDQNIAKVAFKNKCGKYLSISPYGKRWKSSVVRILISVNSIVFPNHIIKLIIELAYDSDRDVVTDSGLGFNYQPGTVNDSIGFSEIFQVVHSTKRQHVGIKTLWGSFLRAPDWSESVLQSPHFDDDEMFLLKRLYD